MSSIRTYFTNEFSVPTLSAPNGAVIDFVDGSVSDEILSMVAGTQLAAMVDLVARQSDIQKIIGTYSIAVKKGSAWNIYLPSDGMLVVADSAMNFDSMVFTPVDVVDGNPSFYLRGAEGPAAFWTNFKNAAEDEFGDSGTGWIPDDPVPHDGVFTATVDLEAQGDGFGWENPEVIGSRVVSVYTYLDTFNTLEVGVNFGGMEHGIPVSLTLSSPSFSSQTVDLTGEFDGIFYFYGDGLDLDGTLAEGGVADVTAVVAFA